MLAWLMSDGSSALVCLYVLGKCEFEDEKTNNGREQYCENESSE